jgi:hypothetical protein
MMIPRKKMSIAYLHECFAYEPDTGIFTWKERPLSHFRSDLSRKRFNITHEGTKAGSIMTCGRIALNVNKTKWLASRVAWAMMKGRWPKASIDHINGDHSDNSFVNLREATLQQNQFNRRPNKNNNLGVKGVSLLKNARRNKYRATIQINRKTIRLGRFETLDEAAQAYANAARKFHGEFVCLERKSA